MSLLKSEELRKIEDGFTKKEYRLLAHELMGWDHTPSVNEGREIAAKYGVTTENLRYVIKRLRHFDLFTEAEGSIPLYRSVLVAEETPTHVPEIIELGVEAEIPETSMAQTQETPEQPETHVETPSHIQEPINPERETNEKIRGLEDQIQGLGDLNFRVNNLGTRMDGIERHLGDIKSFMGQLSAKDTPAQAMVKETVNPSNPTPPRSVPEEAEADVVLPSMDLETENPLEQISDDIMEMEGSIISKKTVGFTPKSLMLFDMARNKGFPGNFADFVNSCITSSFKGRSFKLVVQEEVG